MLKATLQIRSPPAHFDIVQEIFSSCQDPHSEPKATMNTKRVTFPKKNQEWDFANSRAKSNEYKFTALKLRGRAKSNCL